MPKEGKYFELFDSHAALIAQGGKTLLAMVSALAEKSDQAQRFADEIDEIERKADLITHSTLEQLHTSFITPFDRDEIHELINGMDDILDIMQDAGEAVALYDIQQVPAEAREIAEVSNTCCLRVQAVVGLLSSMNNAPSILKLCHEIDDLESDVDRLLRSAMSRLFRDEPDVRQVLKLKEIYQLLESVSDRCKSVASTIEAIVLENS